MLPPFIDNDQRFHNIAMDKLLTGLDGILDLLDDSPEVHGLFRERIYRLVSLYFTLFLHNDITSHGLVPLEKFKGIDMPDYFINY